MKTPYGIIVFGPNGSGKTTLSRELARMLGFKHMDHEDYHFVKSEIPYTVSRSWDECLSLMLADIEKHGNFLLSAVTGDFGDIIPTYYRLGVYVQAPKELRMRRIQQRAYENHGERIRAGGDMHEQHSKFMRFSANRSLLRIDQWCETLSCPVIRVDGTMEVRVSAENVGRYVARNP